MMSRTKKEKLDRKKGISRNSYNNRKKKDHRKRRSDLSARSKKLWGLDSNENIVNVNNDFDNEEGEAQKEEDEQDDNLDSSGWLNDEIDEDDVQDDEEKTNETNTVEEKATSKSLKVATNNDGSIAQLKSLAAMEENDENVDDNIEELSVQIVGRERVWSG